MTVSQVMQSDFFCSMGDSNIRVTYVCVCSLQGVVTVSGDTDDIDLAAHYGTYRKKLFAEDYGLDPDIEPVRHKEKSSLICDPMLRMMSRESGLIGCIFNFASLSLHWTAD